MDNAQLKERLLLKKNYEISARDLICGTTRMIHAKWSNPSEVREVERKMERIYGGVDNIRVWEGFVEKSYEKRITSGHEVLSWMIGNLKYIRSWVTRSGEQLQNIFADFDRSTWHDSSITLRAITAQVDKRRKENREYKQALKREPLLSRDITETSEW